MRLNKEINRLLSHGMLLQHAAYLLFVPEFDLIRNSDGSTITANVRLDLRGVLFMTSVVFPFRYYASNGSARV